MSQSRGKTLHREFPELIRPLFPFAEPCPPGRNGTDVLGTPGVAWEIKASGLDNLRPAQWIAQATRHTRAVDLAANGPGDIPIVAWFPPGVGIRSPHLVVAMTPLPDLLRLLIAAGYAPDRQTDSDGVLDLYLTRKDTP